MECSGWESYGWQMVGRRICILKYDNEWVKGTAPQTIMFWPNPHRDSVPRSRSRTEGHCMIHGYFIEISYQYIFEVPWACVQYRNSWGVVPDFAHGRECCSWEEIRPHTPGFNLIQIRKSLGRTATSKFYGSEKKDLICGPSAKPTAMGWASGNGKWGKGGEYPTLSYVWVDQKRTCTLKHDERRGNDYLNRNRFCWRWVTWAYMISLRLAKRICAPWISSRVMPHGVEVILTQSLW